MSQVLNTYLKRVESMEQYDNYVKGNNITKMIAVQTNKLVHFINDLCFVICHHHLGCILYGNLYFNLQNALHSQVTYHILNSLKHLLSQFAADHGLTPRSAKLKEKFYASKKCYFFFFCNELQFECVAENVLKFVLLEQYVR